MFENDEPLFGQAGRRWHRPVLPYTSQIPKDPRIADGAPGDDETVESGPFHKIDRSCRIENVAAADNRCVGQVPQICVWGEGGRI